MSHGPADLHPTDLVARLAAAGGLVSPVDEAHRTAAPLAPRPDTVAGRRVVLLDITKNRGAQLLDRLEVRLQGLGATTSRISKEIFSRPASPEVIRRVREQGELVVEALAD